jgi:hypothetical protein
MSGDDAAPLPLPTEARGHQVTPDGIVTNAAIDVNGVASEMNDGAIVHVAPQGASARFVGGMSNDQLYAVASNGTEILAVGITRSFRGTAVQDQLMLVRTEARCSHSLGSEWTAITGPRARRGRRPTPR